MTRTVVEQITQAGVQKLRFSGAAPGRYPVFYTHLDVYKRQSSPRATTYR